MSQIDIHCGAVYMGEDFEINAHWKDQNGREFIANLRIGVNHEEDLFVEVNGALFGVVMQNGQTIKA